MSRRFTPKIVTANDLHLGDVVYLTADDRWSRHHHEAELIEDEAIADIRRIEASRQTGTGVCVYLADARPGPRGPQPVHFREAFHAGGRSNCRCGKESDAAATRS